MSDEALNRIAVLQHRRRQAVSRDVLSKISDELGESYHQPVEPDISLRLREDLDERFNTMKSQGSLGQRRFTDAEGAVAAFVERLEMLGSEAVFDAHIGHNAGGFFSGSLSSRFLNAYLRQGHEGLVAVLPGLGAGVLLDVVIDDPLYGNFYEVEWW